MDEKELIRIHFETDRSQEPARYRLVSEHPDYPDLEVSVGSDEMSERVAKAKLIQRMYEIGRERGIPASRLRFRINGPEG